jgi:hypothetical protein
VGSSADGELDAVPPADSKLEATLPVEHEVDAGPSADGEPDAVPPADSGLFTALW